VAPTAHSDPAPGATDLRIIYLIVRPEEKHALERALQNVVPPIYSTMRGVGRGRDGGLAYGLNGPKKRGSRNRRWWRRRSAQPGATFLPKMIFYLVVPGYLVVDVLAAASASLRVEGGPARAGLGVGFVVPMCGHRVVGEGGGAFATTGA